MQCDSCNSGEASIFLTHIVNGKMQKVNLCPACAKAKGVNDPTGFQLTDLLMGIGSSSQVDSNPGLLKCPVCGFTQTDLKKTARMGCSNCYEVFAEMLGPMLKSMHKGTHHKGKVPARVAEVRLRQQELRDLQESLDSAVDQEQYEKAAEIRDQIRKLGEPEVREN